MTGSLGMLASTLPVQWLLPTVGWRGLFWGLAALLVLAIVVIAVAVPRDRSAGAAEDSAALGYREIVRHPSFVRLAPLAFFVYGGLIAMQSLWAGPWLTDVAGYSAAEAAGGLFVVNLSMLATFFMLGRGDAPGDAARLGSRSPDHLGRAAVAAPARRRRRVGTAGRRSVVGDVVRVVHVHFAQPAGGGLRPSRPSRQGGRCRPSTW